MHKDHISTLKILESMSELGGFRNTKTPSMYRRFGNATLSPLAFPEESVPNFYEINPDETWQLLKKSIETEHGRKNKNKIEKIKRSKGRNNREHRK